MRVLVTIPHYQKQSDSPLYGSLKEPRERRVAALRATLTCLHEAFGQRHYAPSLKSADVCSANQTTAISELKVILCVMGDEHVLPDLNLPDGFFHRCACEGDPRLLGFACHEVLRRQASAFDYFVYLEDDIWIHDPWLFRKLQWFGGQADDDCLLQPNRYELSSVGTGEKVYIDGELPREKIGAAYWEDRLPSSITLPYLGSSVTFERARNPHAGCFFLGQSQMQRWRRSSNFLDGDTSFYSPLESAATLSLMKTFAIYKPAVQVANFLEVQHAGDAWMKKIARRNTHWRRNGSPSTSVMETANAEQKSRSNRGEPAAR